MQLHSLVSLLLFWTSFLILNVEQGAEALKCHQCNSAFDKDCADPMWMESGNDAEGKKLVTMQYLADCPKSTDTLCRKIVQNIRGDNRVLRSCGHIEHKTDCYQTVMEEYNTQVCHCKEDGCNGASSSSYAVAVIGSALLATLFM